MRFAIFTLVEHKEKDGVYYGYAPYISEMNMWTNYADEVVVVGLRSKSKTLTPIDAPYNHPKVDFVEVPNFNIKTLKGVLRTLMIYPRVALQMIKVMRSADHLHFRCPSNVSAMAALIQICFPAKKKTVKYAGNWRPKSKQPIGYRFQKFIFRNTWLTKNMKVLVYGEWPNQTKNVVPFMSATYTNAERIPFEKKNYDSILNFVFIGSLVIGKRPMYTIEIIEALIKKGVNCELHMYGDGNLKAELQDYVHAKNLDDKIFIYGNQSKIVIKDAVQKAHFTILPSKSEGWPKAIAEGMFFGAIPISTRISCLEWILGEGQRGILIDTDLETAVEEIFKTLNEADLHEMSKKALDWAQQYTLDRLNLEMKKALEI